MNDYTPSEQRIYDQAYKLGQIEGVLRGPAASDSERVRRIRVLLGLDEPTWTDTGSGPGHSEDQP